MLNSTEQDIVVNMAARLRSAQYYPATPTNIQLSGDNVGLGGKPNTMTVTAVLGNPEGMLNSTKLGYTKINLTAFESRWGGIRVPIADYPTVGSFLAAIRESVGITLQANDIVFAGPIVGDTLTIASTLTVTAAASSVKYTGSFTVRFFIKPAVRLRYEYVLTSARTSIDVCTLDSATVSPSLFTVKINGVAYPGVVRAYAWNSNSRGIMSVTGTFPAGTVTIDIEAFAPLGLGFCSLNGTITSTNWIAPSRLIEYTENGYTSQALALIGTSSTATTLIEPDCLSKNTIIPVNLQYAFALTKMSDIPAALFKGVLVGRLTRAFYGTAITAIPETLFSQAAGLEGDFGYVFGNCAKLVTAPVTPLPPNKITVLAGMFQQTGLATFPGNWFRNCGACKDISYLFSQAKITTLPANILAGLGAVTNASWVFAYLPITAIPVSVLAPIPLTTNLSYGFYTTGIGSIPSGLMDNVPLVRDVTALFANCGSLTTLPEKLFTKTTALTNCYMLFYQCYYIDALPDDLFYGMVNVTDVGFMLTYVGSRSPTATTTGWTLKVTTFKDLTAVTTANRCCMQVPWTKLEVGCLDGFVNCAIFANFFGGGSWSSAGSPIPEIPEDLFRALAKATNFAGMFAFSQITTIPEKLLQLCPSKNIQTISGMFMNCNLVRTVPVDFLKGQSALTDISWLFGNYINGPSPGGLTSIPATLFRDCVNVTTVVGLLSGTWLTAIPSGLFTPFTKVTTIEQVCYRMDRLVTVPGDLFATMVNVTEIASAFSYCTALVTLPATLFASQTKLTRGAYAFAYCSALTAIPGNLYATCTSLSYVPYMFQYCISLLRVPAGLFVNCPTLNMTAMFQGCVKITGIDGVWYKITSNSSTIYLDLVFAGCDALTLSPGSMPYSSGTRWVNMLSINTIPAPFLQQGYRGTVAEIDAACVPAFAGAVPQASGLGGNGNGLYNPFITGSAQTFMTKIGWTQSQLTAVFGIGTRVTW